MKDVFFQEETNKSFIQRRLQRIKMYQQFGCNLAKMNYVIHGFIFNLILSFRLLSVTIFDTRNL